VRAISTYLLTRINIIYVHLENNILLVYIKYIYLPNKKSIKYICYEPLITL